MDIALLTANANQLRFLIIYNSEEKTFYISAGLIVLSLIIQVCVGIGIIFKVSAYTVNRKHRQLNFLTAIACVPVVIETLSRPNTGRSVVFVRGENCKNIYLLNNSVELSTKSVGMTRWMRHQQFYRYNFDQVRGSNGWQFAGQQRVCHSMSDIFCKL